MKINIQQIIYFCLINYVGTFPTDLFDELWQTNQTEPQPNNNPIESQPKIKVEPHEEQFDGKWQDESALKGNVKVEHGPHYGAVKLEAPSEDDLDQDNSKKHWSDQNNSTDQDENVDEQQNEFNECKKIKSDQQKREIIQKFREIKNNYKKKNKLPHSNKERRLIEKKIANSLDVGRTILYKWIKELGLRKETKSKFSDLEKREILKQFDEIKSKCNQTKLKNLSMNELDDKIGKKLGVSKTTILRWKGEFGFSVSKKISDLEKREILKQFDEIKNKCQKAKLKNTSKHELDDKIAKKLGVSKTRIFKWKGEFGFSVSKKISETTKIGILKKYIKTKRKNPKMSDLDIVNLLKISRGNLCKWKAQFREETKHF